MIRDYLLHYLSLVPEDNGYKKQAEALKAEYEHIPSISSRFVPDHSIFREFIGQKEESCF